MFYVFLLIFVATWSLNDARKKGPGAANNHHGNKKIDGNEIDADRIPPSIKHVTLPNVRLTDEGVNFDVPDEVRERLFTKDQTDVLKGACKKSYEAYADGTRMQNMKDVMGQSAYDMIVEYVLYDYLIGDCDWVDTYFGDVIGEWGYVPKEKSGIFEHLSDHGSIASEAVGYFAYWLEKQTTKGNTLYGDGAITWKLKVAEAFEKLKKVHVLKTGGPGELKQLKCERINPVNFFREPGNDELNYQDESDEVEDDEEDEEITAKRVDDVVEFISHREQNDVSGPSVRKEHDPDWEPNPTGYTVQVTMMVDVCIGICVKVGAGLSWNAITEEEYVHWSYGMGSLDSHSSQQDVRMQVAHFCETTISWGNIWHVGYVTDTNTAYNHMYTENWEDFLGISYDIGYLHPYEADAWNEKTQMHFAWHHTKRLARRALSASVRKHRNIKELQDEGVPDSEIVALQSNEDPQDEAEAPEEEEEEEEEETKNKHHKGGDDEDDEEVEVADEVEEDLEAEVAEEKGKHKGGDLLFEGEAHVGTQKKASSAMLNWALVGLCGFLTVGWLYWCLLLRKEKGQGGLPNERTPLLTQLHTV